MSMDYTKHPFQTPRLEEIQGGRKFWGYLDTEALQTRYVLAAHFVKDADNIIEVGGYRNNAITNFLTGQHKSVTVFSLDAEFEPLVSNTLNGAPCRVRHIVDHFQNHTHETDGLGLVALGLEIVGAAEPFYDLLRKSVVAVIGVPVEHQPSMEAMSLIFRNVDSRIRCQINLDLAANEPLLREELQDTNMNRPFWERILYILQPERTQR